MPGRLSRTTRSRSTGSRPSTAGGSCSAPRAPPCRAEPGHARLPCSTRGEPIRWHRPRQSPGEPIAAPRLASQGSLISSARLLLASPANRLMPNTRRSRGLASRRFSSWSGAAGQQPEQAEDAITGRPEASRVMIVEAGEQSAWKTNTSRYDGAAVRGSRHADDVDARNDGVPLPPRCAPEARQDKREQEEETGPAQKGSVGSLAKGQQGEPQQGVHPQDVRGPQEDGVRGS